MMCRITRTILAGVDCFSLSYAFICRTTRIIDYDLPHSLSPPLSSPFQIYNTEDLELSRFATTIEFYFSRRNDKVSEQWFNFKNFIPIYRIHDSYFEFRDYRSNIYHETLDFFSRREDRDSFSDRPVFYRLQRGSRSLARHQRSNLLYVFSCVSFFFFLYVCVRQYGNAADAHVADFEAAGRSTCWHVYTPTDTKLIGRAVQYHVPWI